MSEDVETIGAYFGYLTPKERQMICRYLVSGHGPLHRTEQISICILPFIPLHEVIFTLKEIEHCYVCRRNLGKTPAITLSKLTSLQEKFHEQSNTPNDAVLPAASDAN